MRARADVVDAGSRLFLRDGFAATTVAAVAEAAGVSPETIYKSFGGKSGLVRAIWARALEGDGPTPAEQRSDTMQAAEQDPRVVIRHWGELMVEVSPRVAPILLLVRSAASVDPEMANLLVEVDAQRLRRMERNARTLHDRGQLRHGMTLREARDILWTYSSPALYELLVVKSEWSIQRFGRFVSDQLIAALLPPRPHDDRSRAPAG
jgi:AcrR family transcriptional regulator